MGRKRGMEAELTLGSISFLPFRLFVRQNRCGPPPEFVLTSSYSGIVHQLSGGDWGWGGVGCGGRGWGVGVTNRGVHTVHYIWDNQRHSRSWTCGSRDLTSATRLSSSAR